MFTQSRELRGYALITKLRKSSLTPLSLYTFFLSPAKKTNDQSMNITHLACFRAQLAEQLYLDVADVRV